LLNFVNRYSAILLASCVFIGFLLPEFSKSLLPWLPWVLYALMQLTVISLNHRSLIKDLSCSNVWYYAIWHGLGTSILVIGLAWLLNLEHNLYLALAATCATGSLFASPAIVRSLGLDSQRCMAMTIASTLLMPGLLLLNGQLFSYLMQRNSVQLDMVLYFNRLLIFIILPVIISALCHSFFKQHYINKALIKIKPITIVLVFFFPLGLMGAFRDSFDQNMNDAIYYLAVACLMSSLIFFSSYLLYRHQGKDMALTSAITATNRNVLLSYSITGSYLGSEFLIYMGALQLPIYLLPLLVKTFVHRNL